MKTVRDFDFSDENVLLRADLDEPVEDGELVDDFRLRKAIPTIRHVMKQCKSLRILGHLDRPGGEFDKDLSLQPVVEYLSNTLDTEVPLICDYDSVPEKDILVLENLRFHRGERENTDEFADKLSSLGEIYVNEAFAVSHRRHASIVGVPSRLPGCVGLQFEKEMQHLQLDNMNEPVVAILGGAKLETKMPVIKHLLSRVDTVLLGGAMIFTFYKAKGYEVGDSLVDEDFLLDAKTLLGNEKLVLPDDVVVADTPASSGDVVPADAISHGKQGLDIGPGAVEMFKEYIDTASTVVWNGPLGYDEVDAFMDGTEAIASYLADSDCDTILGGGDTAAVVDSLDLTSEYTHVSTGGGAALTVLEGESLPALQALSE